MTTCPSPHETMFAVPITDALGATIEVSAYRSPEATPTVVIEIEEGELCNVHLSIDRAEAIHAQLGSAIAWAKRRRRLRVVQIVAGAAP